MYGAFDRDEDQVLRSGSIVEVSRLLGPDRSVLWADPQGDSQAGKDRSRGNSQRGFLKIAKYRNSSIAIPLSTLLTACNAPRERADAHEGYADFFTSGQISITFPRFCGGTHTAFFWKRFGM